MTTGFGFFELSTCGLVQRGRYHSPPKACFILGAQLFDWLSKYYEYTVANQNNEYTVAKQNGGGAEWVELFITLTEGMGELTYGRTLAVSHHVLQFEACSAVASEADYDWSGEAAGARLRVNFTLKLLLSQNFCNRSLMRFISFASNIGPAAAVPAGPAPAPLLNASCIEGSSLDIRWILGTCSAATLSR